MSSFLTITIDGKRDRIVSASSTLRERLRAIKLYNAHDPGEYIPTLLDIAKTHILFRG